MESRKPRVGGEVWNGFTVHNTPTHLSWLNQAEIEIGLLTGCRVDIERCLATRPLNFPPTKN
ncbi:MAG: hypothetical protein JWO80_3040 [Bryobacterales bacterium]|nr:hypothetical protein [Bryobacterales bacterium]